MKRPLAAWNEEVSILLYRYPRTGKMPPFPWFWESRTHLLRKKMEIYQRVKNSSFQWVRLEIKVTSHLKTIKTTKPQVVMGVQGLTGSIPLDGGVDGLYSGLAVRVYQSPKKFETMDWGSIAMCSYSFPGLLRDSPGRKAWIYPPTCHLWQNIFCQGLFLKDPDNVHEPK